MKYYLSLLLCLLFTLPWAQEANDALQNYAKQISTVHTLQSNFIEEKHLSLLSEPIQSEGILSFNKNTQQLRWQYQKPFENGFLIEKNKVYRLQGTTKKPIESAMGRLFMAEMLVWLTLDFDSLQKNYSITLNGSEITFVPYHKEHKVVKKITVCLEAKDPRIVTQVKMEEPSGDFIVWKFNNTQINPTLSTEVF
ncbi:MAG: outer membrane lipoprotein carrier protein LolA [Lachnospira sp.]|nr:outer membrane lipoprotein carrier protein LolA [Lachnospira sp.]